MGKRKGFDGVLEFFDDESGVDFELFFDYSLNVNNETLILDDWEAHVYGQDKESLIQDADLSFRMEQAILEHLEEEENSIDWIDEKYLAKANEE